MRKIGIIGGTGIYSPEAMKDFETKVIETPYGKALCSLGTMAGNQVAFITRHGAGHTVAPHMINYRANIWALKSLGTEEIFATSATGSLNPEMTAGHFVVCDQLLDFTKSRINTFYDNPVRCARKSSTSFPGRTSPSTRRAAMSAPKVPALKRPRKSRPMPSSAATWSA